MRDAINQAQLTLQAERFLKRLKSRTTKWNGFYSQFTNLLLDFNTIYDPDFEYIGYLKFFVILRYDLQEIDSNYFDLKDELKIFGYREIRAWLLDLSEDFEKDYITIEKQKNENRIEINKYCGLITDKYLSLIHI